MDVTAFSSSAAREAPRRRWAVAGFFFVLAFALRLAFLTSSSDATWPHSMRYEGDAPVWARWAAALGRGESFEFDLPLRAPGVAYVLHALGLSFFAAKVLWCALSSAGVALLYVVAESFAGARVGRIAAVLAAFAFGDYQLATSLNNEAPYALLLLVSIAATLRWVERPTIALSVALGIVHGAASLLRAEHVLFVVLASAWALSRAWPVLERRRGALVGLSLTAVALIATCAPWSLAAHRATARFNRDAPSIAWETYSPPWSAEARAELEALPAFAREPNARYLSNLRLAAGDREVDVDDVRAFFAEWGSTPEPIPEWTLVTWKGPLDFALANHPSSDGGFSRAGLLDGRAPDPTFSFARPSHLRLLEHGWKVGFDELASDPARSAKLLAAKLARFVDGATLGFGAYDLPYGPSGVRRPVDLTVPTNAPLVRAAFALVLVVGLFVARRRRVGALFVVALLYKLSVTLAFYGYARQAVSIGFVFAFLGALTLDEAVSRALAFRPSLSTPLAWLGRLAVLALFALDCRQWSSPLQFEVRSTAAEPHLVSPSEWGSVESFDELALEPRDPRR
ncbi:MAG: glycosyltransferase family 39 protein [Planctomycetes bacterium]|nr:glycosyltransferase family 39 protein [Planctomycetota bacterium]